MVCVWPHCYHSPHDRQSAAAIFRKSLLAGWVMLCTRRSWRTGGLCRQQRSQSKLTTPCRLGGFSCNPEPGQMKSCAKLAQALTRFCSAFGMRPAALALSCRVVRSEQPSDAFVADLVVKFCQCLDLDPATVHWSATRPADDSTALSLSRLTPGGLRACVVGAVVCDMKGRTGTCAVSTGHGGVAAAVRALPVDSRVRDCDTAGLAAAATRLACADRASVPQGTVSDSYLPSVQHAWWFLWLRG